MDKENASFENALSSVEEILETRAVPTQLPIGQEDQFAGVVDVIQMAAYLQPDGSKRAAKSEIPADLETEAEETREALVEVAAESDDELIEKFFEGELSDEEIQNGLQLGIFENQFIPVLCGAALNNIGVQQLMDTLLTGCPSPTDVGAVTSTENEEDSREPSPDALDVRYRIQIDCRPICRSVELLPCLFRYTGRGYPSQQFDARTS